MRGDSDRYIFSNEALEVRRKKERKRKKRHEKDKRKRTIQTHDKVSLVFAKKDTNRVSNRFLFSNNPSRFNAREKGMTSMKSKDLRPSACHRGGPTTRGTNNGQWPSSDQELLISSVLLIVGYKARKPINA